MTLSEDAIQRLADVVALQPTKNAELQDRWDLDSGSEVHRVLEDELGDYYYRDEDSLICATPEAADLVAEEGLIEGGNDDQVLHVPELQAAIVDVIAGPDEDTQSVVSVLQSLRAAGRDPAVEDVRKALRNLTDKGILERVRTTVPTFRLAVERDELVVDVLEA
ncbi:hypothetical protein Hrd1104_08030 [Halorhabdus sp. CBA1104]|uniref:DUF5797 family protein n=1 Tax=unclassified Halorhabdus TaxID=2621901 RepID=UPI0012B348D4|nr:MULTISPECIES: DUF5797 family protein [unclassified Halorhabdus]QGN07255.1 hypothetical protein Hrd1104_08030 [Halorhabdus sp. CBA1104]